MERYQRQMLLPDFGEEGQRKLLNASALLVGVGGLGSLTSTYLAGAGLGKIGIMDADTVSLSNLHRQVLYHENQMHRNKALCAVENLGKRNSEIELIAYPEQLDHSNAVSIISQYDLVIDGTDNFTTRYLLNDVCVGLNKPFFYGSISLFEGQVATFNTRKDSATYRCLYPDSEALQQQRPPKGVLGSIPAVAASLQTNEVIKYITGCGKVLTNQLLVFNLQDMFFTLLDIHPSMEERKKAESNYAKIVSNEAL